MRKVRQPLNDSPRLCRAGVYSRRVKTMLLFFYNGGVAAYTSSVNRPRSFGFAQDDNGRLTPSPEGKANDVAKLRDVAMAPSGRELSPKVTEGARAGTVLL